MTAKQFDVCLCSHGIERHSPSTNGNDFCWGRPTPEKTWGDREIGTEGSCTCNGFRPETWTPA